MDASTGTLAQRKQLQHTALDSIVSTLYAGCRQVDASTGALAQRKQLQHTALDSIVSSLYAGCRHVDPSTGALTQRKRLSLGTKPITLRPLQANGAKHVFAASDRPTIIHSANSKLVYSNLNEQHVSHCWAPHISLWCGAPLTGQVPLS